MQIDETLAEGLKREYRITIPGADLESRVNEKLAQAQPEIGMKGFRKGKVPMALLKKQFGSRLMGEAMQEAIEGAMQGHLEESGDRPAGPPDVKMVSEDWKAGDDAVVSMAYEKLPEIPDVDYKALRLERLTVAAADDDVRDALDNLASRAGSFAPKEGGIAAEGDQVVFDFEGTMDGTAFEGGAAEDYPLVLGSGSFLPEFEDRLVGTKKGDDLEVNVTFPEGYGAEHLAGKAAVFKCSVKEVREPVPAEIDDDLAKKFGADDLEALKARITERLKSEYGGAARQVVKRALLDQLEAQIAFDLPPSLVEAETRQIAHQLRHEENPGTEGQDPPEVEATDAHRALAERRVKLGLLLAELGRRNAVEVSDAEMGRAVSVQARRYPGKESEFVEFIKKNPAVQQQIHAPLFEDKVVDFIFEMADVTERDVTRDELKAAVEALEDD